MRNSGSAPADLIDATRRSVGCEVIALGVIHSGAHVRKNRIGVAGSGHIVDAHQVDAGGLVQCRVIDAGGGLDAAQGAQRADRHRGIDRDLAQRRVIGLARLRADHQGRETYAPGDILVHGPLLYAGKTAKAQK